MRHPIAQPSLRVNLSEVFRSVQGEGSRMGRPSVFVRFSGCNLRCRWREADSGHEVICDTDYASFRPERRLVELGDVVAQVRGLIRPGDDLVITGGEPMIFPRAVSMLYDVLGCHHHVTIETNGTRPLPMGPQNLLYSVSPKISVAGGTENAGLLAQHVDQAGSDVQLKFVCASPSDIPTIVDFVRRIRRPVSVYLMPLADSPASLDRSARWVAEAALEHGFCYSDRLHLRLWHGARGV